LGSLLVVSALEFKHFLRDPAMGSKEGIIAPLIILLPLALLIGRTLYLYEATNLFSAFLYASLGISAMCFFYPTVQNRDGKDFITEISAVLFSLAALFLAESLVIGFSISLYGVAIRSVLVAAVGIFLAPYTLRSNSLFLTLSSVLVLFGITAQFLQHPSLVASLLLVIVGAVIVPIGYQKRLPALFYGGVIQVVIGVLYNLKFAARLYEYSPWICLALIGALAILASSVAEKKSTVIQKFMMTLKAHFKQKN
jgi:hypothetical protein